MIDAAWKAVTSCTDPCGITKEILQATRELKVDEDHDKKCRMTREEAEKYGREETGAHVGKSVADVYSSNTEREFHNLALEHRMPLSTANDLLKFIKSIPTLDSESQDTFRAPNVQALHDQLLDFCQGSAIMNKDMAISKALDGEQRLPLCWKDPWALLKRMLQVNKFKDKIIWQPSVLR